MKPKLSWHFPTSIAFLHLPLLRQKQASKTVCIITHQVWLLCGSCYTTPVVSRWRAKTQIIREKTERVSGDSHEYTLMRFIWARWRWGRWGMGGRLKQHQALISIKPVHVWEYIQIQFSLYAQWIILILTWRGCSSRLDVICHKQHNVKKMSPLYLTGKQVDIQTQYRLGPRISEGFAITFKRLAWEYIDSLLKKNNNNTIKPHHPHLNPTKWAPILRVMSRTQ